MKRKFVQCSTLVNPNAVKRETIDGVEHIIVSSFTLPSDIVMNGVMYPADEIDKSFTGLNRTLAPVEHPSDKQGNFVSASDPMAIANFYAGAYNDNAERVGNRVKVDKVINVIEARKSERGKRLLDRIEELETSNDPRPIHTSTGIFLELEELDQPTTNAEGQEYKLIARNMIFDHDAILLDSVGAAQPHQGVGMAVNRDGYKMEVETICGSQMNQSGLFCTSVMDQLRPQVREALNVGDDGRCFVKDVFDDVIVVDTASNGYFEIPYVVDDNQARLSGAPIAVNRVISYQPKTNAKGDEDMRDMIINALKAKGIKVEENATDGELLSVYNANFAPTSNADDGNGDGGDSAEGDRNAIAQAVANGLKPLQHQVAALQSQLNTNADAETAVHIKTVVNSGKYPGLDEDVVKALPADAVKKMAANCGQGHGLPLYTNDGGSNDSVATTMPE